MMIQIRLSLLLLFCVFAIFIKAQDIHHSQFYTSPLNLNPALTGIFNGDKRITLNFRRQWFVDEIVRYLTVTGSYDQRFHPKKWNTKGIWSGGLMFNYDRAGDSRLGLANLTLSISYTYPLQSKHLISIGGQAGISQRRFNKDELVWDAQWDGDKFDPSRATGEDFGKTSNVFADVSAGLNYRWQKSKRTKIDFGISAYHLNKPNQMFFDSSLSIKLPIRLNISVLPNFKLTNSLDLLLHAQFQNQNPYSEALAGAYIKFYANQKRGKELNLLFGLCNRFNDAIIPKIALEWTNWYIGFSYDITQSDFKPYVDQRGGPEFSVIHIITKARPLTLLKSCPIF